ncbi:MAG: bacillithiol biosynthesis BshC, partial [Calditrichota bacterium]
MDVVTSPANHSDASLFSTYLHNFKKVENWYRYHPEIGFDAVLTKRAGDSGFRNTLADILIQQNAAWESTEATMKNIEALRDQNTFAIVTGQQAGIFGGPLYTIYKTITVLKLCKELQNQYPDKKFVPVFWLEVNDSDFEEISIVRYPTKENSLRELKLDEQPEDVSKAVDSREIDADLQGWRSLLEEDFFDTEFKQQAIDSYLNAYSYGGYTDGFARVLHGLFEKYGLVLINPAADEFSELAKP